MIRFQNSWDEILKEEFEKDYYNSLINFLKVEYSKYTIYPPKDDVMNSLKVTDYNDVKVCIVGQDPYHGKGQAHGMAFSVNSNIKIPPSLVNIYKELNDDLGLYIPNNGYLMKWAKEGVLLLNTSLTVRAASPASHSGKGWEVFTDSVISKLNEREKPVVFVLWGSHAKSKKSLITNSRHKILEAAHPSPFSAYNGFFGCKHFSKINEFLKSIGDKEIDWQIENI